MGKDFVIGIDCKGLKKGIERFRINQEYTKEEPYEVGRKKTEQ